jgi:hypothetical protein
MSIFTSHIWNDWLVSRKLHPEINSNFPVYLNNVLSSYVIGYGWYGGRLIEQTLELAETRAEDKPFRKEFRIEFDPNILNHPICNITPIIPDNLFLKEPNLTEIAKFLNFSKNMLAGEPIPCRIAENSVLLDMPAIVDYYTLGCSLVYARSMLANPTRFSDNNQDIEKENSQAYFIIYSICIMMNIINNIPKGESIIAKILKDFINNMDRLARTNEFYVKSVMFGR